jgi:aspartyl-tRNA(Asn)/glutamyl-tRNA(Gln) amidotransferase subunit B
VELPLARKERLIESYDLKEDMAEFIIEEKETADYFEQLVTLGGDARKSANWMSGHLQSQLKRANKRLSETPLSPQRLLKLIDLVDQGQLNANHAKEVLEALLQQDREPEAIIEELGFGQQTDDSEVASFVEQVMTENPNVLEQIKSGNMKPIGFLVGQVMKLSKGQANPKLVQKILKNKLGQ